MKLRMPTKRPSRIEMLPLIDIVFLLLVFFIYAMLSMAVHHAMPVQLPVSSTAQLDKQQILSVTVDRAGRIFLNKKAVVLDQLAQEIQRFSGPHKEKGVLLFADNSITYQTLFNVIDQIKSAGINTVSLEAERQH